MIIVHLIILVKNVIMDILLPIKDLTVSKNITAVNTVQVALQVESVNPTKNVPVTMTNPIKRELNVSNVESRIVISVHLTMSVRNAMEVIRS